MNKLLNNLLGMYKQAKMKKSAMIIDEILDRKDGASYNPQDFYDYVSQQLDVLNSKDIATALDSGTEEDVKKALCEYIKLGEYNPAICDYINSVNWLEEEDVEKWFSIKLSDEQAKEFAKLLTENNIKNKSKKEGEEIRVSFFLLPSSIGVAQGLLAATLSKFPDKQAKLNKKAEEVVYDSDLIAQVLSMTKNQKEDEFSIVTLSPEKDKVLGVKYIKKDDVYDYKPNQNEYALVMTRDTGFADTDYQLQPMIMVVRSWNEGRKFYATKKNRLNKKAEEDLIEVGWGLYTNDEYEIKDNALYGDDKPQEVNETFWNKINNEIDKVESWFLKEGYKKFFTKVRDEGHGKDSELGGTAWMTENQLKDFMANAEQWDTEFVLAESSGTLDFGNIPVDYNEALSFKLKIYVDDKDLDELGIESKRVSKNKKLSSKAKDMRKKAEYTKKDYLNHFRDIKQDVLFDNKGNFVEAVKDLLGFASSEYDKARFPREDVYNLVKEYIDDTINFQEMINHPIKEEYIVKAKELLNKYKVENKIANSIKTLHKKSENFDEAEEFAKKIIEENKYAFSGHTDMAKLENNAYSMFLMDNASIKEVLDEAKKIVSELDNDKDKKFEDAGLYFGMKDRALLAEKVLEEKTKQEKQSSKSNRLQKKAKIVLEQIGNEYYLDGKKGDYSDFNYDGKYKQTNYNVFVDDKGKTHKVWEFEGTLDKQTTKKQAKYEETVQGDEKVKDSAKSFGYDIKFAGHYGRWIYYYLIDEKGNIIRDDKEYQKVYDEMKKRIDDDIDINNYDFVKALIEDVDGKLMRVPTIAISEYSLLSNHKDREENTGLEEFKRDFNLSSSTKKQATIKHENGVYNVYSESGKCLGKGYKTKEEAEKRLKQVEYFKHKKASVIKKAKNLSEIDGDAEFMSDLEIGNGMPYNSDDYDYFEVYKIHAKNPKDTYNNKYVVVSDDGSILAVREKEEDIIEITYDDMLQELRWRRLSNRKTQPNKRTSLKQVVISKMAKIKK